MLLEEKRRAVATQALCGQVVSNEEHVLPALP